MYRKYNRKKNNLILDIFFILIFASMWGFVCNTLNSEGSRLSGLHKKKYSGIIYISIEEAKIKYNSKISIFVDSRDSSEYNYAHIKKSINIHDADEDDPQDKIEKKIIKLNNMKELVIYCNGTTCNSSTDLAKKIIDMGYKRHVYIIKKGFPEWESKGFPINKYKK